MADDGEALLSLGETAYRCTSGGTSVRVVLAPGRRLDGGPLTHTPTAALLLWQHAAAALAPLEYEDSPAAAALRRWLRILAEVRNGALLRGAGGSYPAQLDRDDLPRAEWTRYDLVSVAGASGVTLLCQRCRQVRHGSLLHRPGGATSRYPSDPVQQTR